MKCNCKNHQKYFFVKIKSLCTFIVVILNIAHLQEICSSPKLVVDGVGPNDLNQGSLGNCWFIAACTSLSLDHKSWHRVVPDANHQVGVLYICTTVFGYISSFGELQFPAIALNLENSIPLSDFIVWQFL